MPSQPPLWVFQHFASGVLVAASTCCYSQHMLLPVLAVAPVTKGGQWAAPLSPVPTILGEPFLTTVVVDSLTILVRIRGRISKPIAFQGAEATLVWIGWLIAPWY